MKKSYPKKSKIKEDMNLNKEYLNVIENKKNKKRKNNIKKIKKKEQVQKKKIQK